MFILEILSGNRAQPGSFWEVPKKCHRYHPIKPKKPEVTPSVAPVALKKPEVSLIAACVAEAILKKPDQMEEDAMEEDAMTGFKPSILTDPPPSCFSFSSLTHPRSFSETVFLKVHPFPQKFDHMKIKKWLSEAKNLAITFRDVGTIIREAGHMDPDQL